MTQLDLSPAPVRTGVSFWLAGEQPSLHGNSAPLSALRQFVHRAAGLPAHVLISGEAGTGKELVARCLHNQSGRRGSFVFVDCSAHHSSDLGIELFGPCLDAAGAEMFRWDTAANGTLFLKNIDALDPCLQSRLAHRAASNMAAPAGVRLVTSTRCDLAAMVQEGRFLSSLYYAISTVQIETMPLRAVPDDVDQLFDLFVQQAARRFGVAPPAITDDVQIRLAVCTWPGNFRELRQLAERTVLGVGEAFAAGSSSHGASGSLVAAVEAFERALICCEMRKKGGSVVAASEALSIPKTTLYDKLHKYKITSREYKIGNSGKPPCAPSAYEQGSRVVAGPRSDREIRRPRSSRARG